MVECPLMFYVASDGSKISERSSIRVLILELGSWLGYVLGLALTLRLWLGFRVMNIRLMMLECSKVFMQWVTRLIPHHAHQPHGGPI